MSENNQSIMLSPAKAITKRPGRALLPLTARRIVPAVGAAAALAWGASRIVAQVVKQRRQQRQRKITEIAPNRPVLLYRRRAVRITISNRE